MAECFTALVTGATRGIGAEVARVLASRGIHVLAAGRRAEDADRVATQVRAGGGSAEAVTLDLTLESERGEVAKHLRATRGRLDILVNNAALWLESASASSPAMPPSATPEAVLRQIMDANFIGAVLLTQELLPLLEQAPAARIVNVSTIHASLALQADPDSPIYRQSAFAYATSKTALNSFTLHLARELGNTPIKVNSVHPGWVRTDMGGPSAAVDVSDAASTIVGFATLGPDGPTGGFFNRDGAMPW